MKKLMTMGLVALGASFVLVASASAAGVPYLFNGVASYQLFPPFAPVSSLPSATFNFGPLPPTPNEPLGAWDGVGDTGLLVITNNSPCTTFCGNIGFNAISGCGLNFNSSHAVCLAPGQSAALSINNESSNFCGYNGPFNTSTPQLGAEFFMNGTVSLDPTCGCGSGTELVDLSIFDKDIHSGVFRTNPFGVFLDNDILQGGDPFGRDTGDTYEVSQAPGPFQFASSIGPGGPGDHFLSYKIKPSAGSPKFQPILGVSLSDQFEQGLFDVTAQRCAGAPSLYNPADKNCEGIPDPLAHLKGYQIRLTKMKPPQPKHVPHNVQVTNQFPQTLRLTTVKPDRLLVPTTKCIDQPGNPCPVPLPPPNPATVDHFKCYKVKITKGTPKFQPILGVRGSDQFTPPKVFDLENVTRLCNPVDKHGEGIMDPTNHLLCYKATPAKGQPKHLPVKGIHLSNQFGLETVDTVREEDLCVPSLKQDLPAALGGDSVEGEEADDDEDD